MKSKLTKDWIVGFFEGEGCFSVTRWTDKDKVYFYPKITLAQKNKEILEDIKKYLSLGSIHKIQRDCYQLTIDGFKSVSLVFKKLNFPESFRLKHSRERYSRMIEITRYNIKESKRFKGDKK